MSSGSMKLSDVAAIARFRAEHPDWTLALTARDLRAVEDVNGYFAEKGREACIAWMEMLKRIPPPPEGHHYQPRIDLRPCADNAGATLVITACLVKTYRGGDG